MLKHKIQELLTPFKHVYCTSSCKTTTILVHIHVQPYRPKENIGNYLSPYPYSLFHTCIFIFCLLSNLPLILAWLFKNVLSFKIKKNYVILPISFLFGHAFNIHQLQRNIYRYTQKIHVPVHT